MNDYTRQDERSPSGAQLALLRRLMGKGFKKLPASTTRGQAHQIISECLRRCKLGLKPFGGKQ